MPTIRTDAAARLLKLHPDQRVAAALAAKNFHSALQIAGTAPSHFAQLMGDDLPGGGATAREVHIRATQVRSTLLHAWSTLRSAVHSPQYRALAGHNLGDDIAARFAQLPSYAELFGSLDYCECAECRSIFGPAAYLVDLLRIIDTYVTTPNQIPAALQLGTRRGDLGRIPLTCENTNTTFPLLRIVNERLTQQAHDLLHLPPGADLFAALSTLTYPYNLPLHLPLERIGLTLAAADIGLADLHRGFGSAASEVARARLKLSLEASQFLCTSLAADPGRLAAANGVSAAALPALAEADKLMAATGLTADALQDLLAQHLSAAELAGGVAANFFINGGLGGKTLSYLPADAEAGKPARIANLDNDALDRLGRFVRLARRLGWEPAQLDWALRIASGGQAAISPSTLTALAEMMDLATLAQLDMPTLCSLLGPIQTYGEGGDAASAAPFDRLFNDPRVIGTAAPYRPGPNPLNPLYQSQPLPWTVGGGAPDDLALAARLAGALGVRGDLLNRLAAALFPKTPVLQLSIDNLSALYRHAVLLRVTGLPPDQHFLWMTLGGWWQPQLSAAALRSLLTGSAWLATSGLTVYQIDYFLHGAPAQDPAPYVNPRYRQEQAGGWLDSVWQATRSLPPGDARNAKLTSLLAAFFGISTDQLAALMALALPAAPPQAGSWQEAFLACASEHSTPSAYVLALLRGLSRWLVLSDAIAAPLPLLVSLGGGNACAAAYGFADPSLRTLALGDVLTLSTFVQQMLAFQDVSGGLIKYVELAARAAPPAEQAAQLAQATQWDPLQLQALLSEMAGGSRTAAIASLQTRFALLRRLGADVPFMRRLLALTSAPAAWSDYTALAEQVLAQVRGVMPDSQWPALALQIDGALAECKRSALLPLVLSRRPDIASPRALSEYLLLDVEVSGVRQISYIREALNAAQFYLQRCRLRLEAGVDQLDIPEAWWEWMMNYRVWEANREIFVYPENYIDPTLRQSQTRLFADLRNQLQQDAVTAPSVDGAYRAYLDNLCKLAQLVYVDAYHGTVHDPVRGEVDTRYLFARTATEPYTYYYISHDGNVWSEWRQIAITIPAALVTPVYVFNHLFLFWVELKTSKPSNDSGPHGVAYTASVKYSFTRFDGSWIQPQVLLSDEVVYYMPSESDQQGALGPLTAASGLFRMTDIFWNKVAVNVIPGAGGQPDKLCVMYGPFLDKGLSASALTPPTAPPPALNNRTSSALSFTQTVFDVTTTYNQFFNSRVLGHLPMVNTALLDHDLNPSCLNRPNEVIVMEMAAGEQTPPLFKPEIDLLSGTVRLVAADSAYQANYLTDYTPACSNARAAARVRADSFISSRINAAGSQQCLNDLRANQLVDENGVLAASFGAASNLSFLFGGAPAALKDLLIFEVRQKLLRLKGDPTLFAALPIPGARLVSVKNQPGSFLLDTGDESYLLTPRASYAQLSDGTQVSPMRSSPIVYSVYFAPVGGTTEACQQIYNDLAGNNVIHAVNPNYGWLSPNFSVDTDLSFLFGGAAPDARTAMITQVRRILLNLPSLTKLRYDGMHIDHVVTRRSFISNDIDAQGSQQAYNDLLANNIINAQGVVSSSFNGQTDLSFMFSGAPPARKEQLIAQVRVIMLSLPKLAQPAAFVSADIDAPSAQAVFNALVANHIMDDQGMLAASFGAGTSLAFLFTEVPEPRRGVLTAQVRRVLQRFHDATYLIDASALHFDSERISARASARTLTTRMFIGGVPELLALETQNAPVVPQVPFDRLAPQRAVSPPRQPDGAQIDFEGPYGEYHWELFFHAPMLVAGTLALNQQYADAKRWLEYILDPSQGEQFIQPACLATADIDPAHAQAAYSALLKLNLLLEVSPGNARVSASYTPASDLGSLFADIGDDALRARMRQEVANVLGNYQLAKPAARVWQFRPFRNHTLASLQAMLTDRSQIATYNNDPFDPHAIARLRIGAYEKTIVMKYVDNLIAWGDMLFAQYTWESITNATLLYMYAGDLLGDKPRDLGPLAPVAPLSFNDIRARYAAGQIPQFLIDLENWLPALPDGMPPVHAAGEAFNALDTYFCVPENAMLGGYWDAVADRLNKIRKGLNIDGQAVPLALFDPPLDPMALVKQAASGAGMLGVLASASQSISSQYRFAPLFEHAMQLTALVTQLGSSLLGALERQDAEQLETLRQTQELALLELSTSMRQQQIEQLQATLDSLVNAQQRAEGEISYYTSLRSNGLSSQEVASKICVAEAILFQSLTVPIRGISIAGYLSPSIFGLADGGMKWGDAIAAGAEISGGVAQTLQLAAQLTATTAEFQRRADEWQHQIDLSRQDVAILQRQIDAARSQLASAGQELKVHQQAIAQANTVGTFLRQRFTSGELYQWMANRLAGIYFQAYRMAVDAAKAAELAYQYETARSDSYINLGYWDSLKKGLLAGEALNFSLHQLRQAYMAGNVRRLQISKTISLLQIDPQQLLNLRQGKQASFRLSETMFDFDFPGHYARQIAAVSLSIPAVAGPCQNINATLTQTRNVVALSPAPAVVEYLIASEHPGAAPLPPAPDASQLRTGWLAAQSIAISRGMNDNGMFELNFSADHFQPFEGTGAVSDWTLDIPPENNRLNLEQLTDVIIELKYSALDGGNRQAVNDILRKYQVQFASKLYLNLRQMFAPAWKAFMSPAGAPAVQSLNVTLTPAMFPYFKAMTARTAAIKLSTVPGVDLAGDSFITLLIGSNSYPLRFGGDGMAAVTLTSASGQPLADAEFVAPWSLQVTLTKVPQPQILLHNGTLDPQAFLNLEVLLSYSADVLGKQA